MASPIVAVPPIVVAVFRMAYVVTPLSVALMLLLLLVVGLLLRLLKGRPRIVPLLEQSLRLGSILALD